MTFFSSFVKALTYPKKHATPPASLNLSLDCMKLRSFSIESSPLLCIPTRDNLEFLLDAVII